MKMASKGVEVYPLVPSSFTVRAGVENTSMQADSKGCYEMG